MGAVNDVCSKLLWRWQHLDDAVWLAALAICRARRLRCVPQRLVGDDQARHFPSRGGRVPRSFRVDLVAACGSNRRSCMAERGNSGADLHSHGAFLGPVAGADSFRKVAGWWARSDVPAFDEHTLDSCGTPYAERIPRLLDGGSGSLKEPTKGAVAGRALSRAERGGYTLTFYIWHCICRSHRYEESRRQVRPSSRHARPPHHEGRCAWTHSRLCHRAKNPADLARRTPGPAGIPLSRTSSPRIQETADGQVAAIRNRPGSQILRAHRQRSSLSQRRDCELEAPH